MAQVSNSRGPLAELTTPRFFLTEVSVMHLSEKCLTPLKHCFKHRFNQKPGFALVLLKSFLLSFYSQTICSSAYRAGVPVPQGLD